MQRQTSGKPRFGDPEKGGHRVIVLVFLDRGLGSKADHDYLSQLLLSLIFMFCIFVHLTTQRQHLAFLLLVQYRFDSICRGLYWGEAIASRARGLFVLVTAAEKALLLVIKGTFPRTRTQRCL